MLHQAGVKTLNNKHAEKEQICHWEPKKDAIQNNMIQQYQYYRGLLYFIVV